MALVVVLACACDSAVCLCPARVNANADVAALAQRNDPPHTPDDTHGTHWWLVGPNWQGALMFRSIAQCEQEPVRTGLADMASCGRDKPATSGHNRLLTTLALLLLEVYTYYTGRLDFPAPCSGPIVGRISKLPWFHIALGPIPTSVAEL